jgi:hypothetical protein
VRELFSLPQTEDIFDDFSCKEGGIVSGRMYLTTTNMCFYSSILGRTKKLIFPWKEISKIEKDSSKAIKVTRESPKQEGAKSNTVTTFSSFSDRDTSFKYIHKLWMNKSPYAEDVFSDDSESEDFPINP